MKKSLLILIFVISSSLCFAPDLKAQSVVIDSLDNIIDQEATSNRERIKALEQLSRIKSNQNKFSKALQLVERAQQLSHKEKDKRYRAMVEIRKSSVYEQQDSLKLAFQAIDSAAWYAKQTNDKIVQGRVQLQKGRLERNLNNTEKAYQHLLEALRIMDGEENTLMYQSIIYHSLAAIHGYWKEYEKQLHYTGLCLKTALKSQDPDAIANAYLSMGTSYLYRYRKNPAQKKLLDSSKKYNDLILKLTKEQEKRMITPNTRGIAALNMANLYFEFYPVSFKDSAKIYLTQALKIGKETNDSEIIANSYGILSGYASKESDFSRAETLLLTGLSEISDRPDATLSKSRINNALAQAAEKSGNSTKALAYYKRYMRYDQELFDEERLSAVQKLEAQYQSEKKELALAAAQQEADFTKKLNRYYLILIVAGIIALFFLFRSYHFKLKASQQQQLLLTGEKNEAELQANLKVEETARLSAERELMQERLDRLEKELLAGTLQVEEKNNLLESLKNKLDSLKTVDPLYQQISRLISKNYEVDNDYDDIRTEFAEIRPEFIASLQLRAENKLTRLDLKYCSYILMGLTNKEIASKLNIAPKSIRMARYRIKRKLKLEKDEKLDRFINDLGTKPNTSY